MNNRFTTFILGAGASHDYGFPLGAQLPYEFRNLLKSEDRVVRSKFAGYFDDEKGLNEFIEVLEKTTIRTIDELVHIKPRFRAHAAWLLGSSLLRKENQSTVFPAKDWYHSLYLHLTDKKLLDFKSVKIVTLNYDRSLEYFLRHVPKYEAVEAKEEDLVKELTAIDVCHLHGSFGTLEEHAFGVTLESLSEPKSVLSRLQFISDITGHEPTYAQARDWLQKSERVYFLGFGYHEAILRKLFYGITPNYSHVAGTIKGVYPKNLSVVNDLIGSIFQGHDKDCGYFVNEVVAAR